MTRVIPFSKGTRPALVISVLLIAAGIAGTVLRGGFNLGIDFQAGLSQRVAIDPAQLVVDIGQVRSALADVADSSAEVQAVGAAEEQNFTVRVRDNGTIDDFEEQIGAQIIDELGEAFGPSAVSSLERSYIGPRFSADLTNQAVMLVILALSLVLVYLWFRFRLAYAASAVIALVHDIVFMIGFIGTFQIEVTSATIAAVLTIVGYSLNDTIVIFDRIRENEAVMGESKLPVIIDGSITQSMSRTLMTSATTLVAVGAIFFFTTGQIKDFALSLIVGIVVGTYSSIYIAGPSFLGISNALKAREKRREAAAAQKATKSVAKSARPAAKGAGAKK